MSFDILTWLQLKNQRELSDLVNDARLFLTSYKPVVEKAPLQIYHSAIIFSPANSLIRKQFLESEDSSNSLSKWVKVSPLLADWDSSVQACKHKLEGHSGIVLTVAFSSDGLLASGSDDKTVRVWDPTTGECKHELKGHSGSVRTVAFSSDGLLASGSSDKTVRVWDPTTGECKHELKGHSDSVWTVAFSSDGLLASGSSDKTVRVWDPTTGECKHELKGHSHSVLTVAFSSDGLLASWSDDETVRVWDPTTGQCKHELKDLTLISQGQQSFLSDCRPPFYSLNGERTWVIQNNRGILHLPDYYYRSTAFTVKGNIMALGYEDGRLIFLKFSQAINL